MNVTIIGATGFIGQAFIKKLLATTDYRVTAFSKSADRLRFDDATASNYQALAGDLFIPEQLAPALHGCDVAVYLVHMMGASSGDYAELEAKGAQAFAAAARKAGVKRVIFLGGLGDSKHQQLSKHLASRQRSGELLRARLPLVIELRASMIIGHGSVGYEIIKAIAHKVPFVVAVPRWAVTPTQPIGLADMLRYLVAAISVPVTTHQIIEVGGPEILTYPQILSRYTAWEGRRQRALIIPGVPLWAAKLWLNQFVSKKASGIGGPMVESLHNPMVVTNDKAQKLFPDIRPNPIEEAFV